MTTYLINPIFFFMMFEIPTRVRPELIIFFCSKIKRLEVHVDFR